MGIVDHDNVISNLTAEEGAMRVVVSLQNLLRCVIVGVVVCFKMDFDLTDITFARDLLIILVRFTGVEKIQDVLQSEKANGKVGELALLNAQVVFICVTEAENALQRKDSEEDPQVVSYCAIRDVVLLIHTMKRVIKRRCTKMDENRLVVSLVQPEMVNPYDLGFMPVSLEDNSVTVQGKNLRLIARYHNSKVYSKTMPFEVQTVVIELVENFHVLSQAEENHLLKMEAKIGVKLLILLLKLNPFVFIVVPDVLSLTAVLLPLVLVDHFKDCVVAAFIEAVKTARQNSNVSVIEQMRLLDLKDSGKRGAAQSVLVFVRIKIQDNLRITYLQP